MKKNLNGFTLAETLIVVVVLGIIATLTIPALVNKNKESVAKTKVRKAMAAYESALNKMIIENDLKDNKLLTDWAGNAENNCANSTNYFKKVQGDGCIFKTSDGIWWNISDIERPVISFKEINAGNAATITTNANNENDKTAFVLVGRFGTDGSLRVDDLAYETSNSIADAYGNQSKAQVEKLYSLLGLKSSSAGGNASPFDACEANNEEICTINGRTYKKFSLNDSSYELCFPCETEEECSEYEEDCSYTTISTAGDYYVAVVGFPDWYNEENAKSEENCATSTYSDCLTDGDYWNLAKTYCQSQGARLASDAEFSTLAWEKGALPNDGSCFFTSDESKSGNFVIFEGKDAETSGYSGYQQKYNPDYHCGVLCIK